MRYEHIADPPLLIVHDTFTDEELRRVWKELDFLTEEDYMLPPERTGTATNEDGSPRKNNAARFIDPFYAEGLYSPVCLYTEKLIGSDVLEQLEKVSPTNKFFSKINHRSVLISYYQNSGYYHPHEDSCFYTITTYLFKEPKRFTGGDISIEFRGAKIEIHIHNNMSIIFPSFYLHEVSEIRMEDRPFSGNGRYCISQFLGSKS